MDIDALTKQLQDARAERKLLDDLIAALESIVARHGGSLAARRAPAARGETERATLAFVNGTEGGPWSPSEVAEAIGKPRGSVSNVLSRLAKNEVIAMPSYGRYARLQETSLSTTPGPDRGLQAIPPADDDDIPF